LHSFKKRLGLAEERPSLRRGGWVATGNWEPDSLAYFLHLLCDVKRAHLFADEGVRAAVNATLDLFLVEQHHEARSPYRYAELPRDGLGAPVAVTGMVWGAHRPSDDAQVYGYNVPVNMFIHSALHKLATHMADERIRPLMRDIAAGIEAHGVVDGAYVYETDGLGHALSTYDDANWPSLLSTPWSGYSRLDKEVYAETRRRLLSPANTYFYKGPQFEGVGSAHTPPARAHGATARRRADPPPPTPGQRLVARRGGARVDEQQPGRG
jgi:meiotically up-regulated gene 157 (Mug157) protein